MTSYSLIIPGDPVPKGRPRVYRGHGVTPSRTRIAESRIRADFMAKYPDGEPFDGPVKVVVEFWKAKRGRPDLDNLVKLVTDALNGVAYRDDEQIQTVEGRCLRAGSAGQRQASRYVAQTQGGRPVHVPWRPV